MRVDWCVSSWFRIKNTHSLMTQDTRCSEWERKIVSGIDFDGNLPNAKHAIAQNFTTCSHMMLDVFGIAKNLSLT